MDRVHTSRAFWRRGEAWATRESGIKHRYQPFQTHDNKELEARLVALICAPFSLSFYDCLDGPSWTTRQKRESCATARQHGRSFRNAMPALCHTAALFAVAGLSMPVLSRACRHGKARPSSMPFRAADGRARGPDRRQAGTLEAARGRGGVAALARPLDRAWCCERVSERPRAFANTVRRRL